MAGSHAKSASLSKRQLSEVLYLCEAAYEPSLPAADRDWHWGPREVQPGGGLRAIVGVYGSEKQTLRVCIRGTATQELAELHAFFERVWRGATSPTRPPPLDGVHNVLTDLSLEMVPVSDGHH